MRATALRREAIFEFIKNEVRDKGYPPSVREIGEAVGLTSSSTVHGHLERLEKRGLIRRDPSKPRAIEVVDMESDTTSSAPHPIVPVIGKVTAGMPIAAMEHIEEFIPLPQDMVKDDTVFLLVVREDSMIEAGIRSGDYVIVRQQQTANNGDMVVAMTEEGEATVKTFYKEKDHIRLQPENQKMDPIRLQRVSILGKVIGVFRNYD